MVCFTIQVILGSFPRGYVRSSELGLPQRGIADAPGPPPEHTPVERRLGQWRLT